jgi:hypothetical protein
MLSPLFTRQDIASQHAIANNNRWSHGVEVSSFFVPDTLWTTPTFTDVRGDENAALAWIGGLARNTYYKYCTLHTILFRFEFDYISRVSTKVGVQYFRCAKRPKTELYNTG